MTKLENEFLEVFKTIESILNERYKCKHGVTVYINNMKKNSYGFKHVFGYKDDYYALKRVRHIRNFISHENGKSDCSKKDLEYLCEFKDRLIRHADPLSVKKNISGKILLSIFTVLIMVFVLLKVYKAI